MKILEDLRKLKIADIDGWIGDANFGFEQLSNYFNHNKKLDILEIGCGIGILMAIFQKNFDNLSLEGIEPYKGGFERLKSSRKILPKKINIIHSKFEDFKPKKKYDIIYSVNVFEHLRNWRQYLQKTESWLKPNGKNIILCPNYSFPYESHFKIPIIVNKHITHRVFKKRIESFERENNSLGLWKSLNFIKMREIEKYCIEENLNFNYCDEVFTDIINRLDQDSEFKKRQNFVGQTAKIFHYLGFLKLLRKKYFHKYHPYMKIEITNSQSN